jgi:hypothetical protein
MGWDGEVEKLVYGKWCKSVCVCVCGGVFCGCECLSVCIMGWYERGRGCVYGVYVCVYYGMVLREGVVVCMLCMLVVGRGGNGPEPV